MATRITAGALETAVGAPAHDAEFVANLHHGRPDVVEELDFGDGLQSARGHADGAADDVGFGERRVENAIGAVFALQAGSGFEDAALPFHVLEIFFAAGVGNVFAENGDALVARHFVGERGGNHFDHGLRRAVKLRLGSKCGRGGIDVGRINVDRGSNRLRAARRRGPGRRLRGLRDRLRLRGASISFWSRRPSRTRNSENLESGSR